MKFANHNMLFACVFNPSSISNVLTHTFDEAGEVMGLLVS